MNSSPAFKEYPHTNYGHKDQEKILTKTAHQWDNRMRSALSHFGRDIWHDGHLLGLIPVHQYRLRKRQLPYAWTWWVEHDIPPYDRFRCAAYMVELYLNEEQEPVLLIRTGEGNHSLTGDELINFESQLARAEAETPLFIFRDFGPAYD